MSKITLKEAKKQLIYGKPLYAFVAINRSISKRKIAKITKNHLIDIYGNKFTYTENKITFLDN